MSNPAEFSDSAPSSSLWPPLPLAEWENTRATLHMWTQIVGKTRLALSPYLNHWWQVPLYVSARGLTTSMIPYRERAFEIDFDFVRHNLWIQVSDGTEGTIALYPRTVADFYREYMGALHSLGIDLKIYTLPVEIPNPIHFEQDYEHASYDADAVNRFWRILMNSDRVLNQFRGGFIGKSSPVHFFWGSFDLAVTRFSGRRAPERPGADPITREAYSHEVISCGFWPGDSRFPEPAYYAYAAPVPPGLAAETVQPQKAFYSQELGEFLLRYDDVRAAESPDEAILGFCESTYDAAARLENWDCAALERNRAAHASGSS
jgi:hypothetical protein